MAGMEVGAALGRSSLLHGEGAEPDPKQLSLGARKVGAPALASTSLGLQSVYRDAHVHVVSDEPLGAAQGKALSQKIEAAYRWDERQQGLADSPRLQAPLTVAVLSRPIFSALTGDSSGSIAGVTTGPNLFVVPDAVVGRKSALDDQTIAHELGHVQDFRDGGEQLKNVPIYLQEGKEYVLGERYPLSERMANPHIQYVARSLGQLTARDAQRVMTDFRTPQDEAGSGNFGFVGETTGALFVEYLRTRLGGKGVPDAVPRVAEVVRQVGQGVSYEKAFGAQFGLSPNEAERGFVQYVAATEGNPEARLSGTLFAPAPAA